jgi:hypothetical protein
VFFGDGGIGRFSRSLPRGGVALLTSRSLFGRPLLRL